MSERQSRTARLAGAFARVGFVIFTLIIAACGGSGDPADSAVVSAADDDIRITLERGACFGYCPMYQVELSGSGKVVFIGRNFVKDTGRFEDTTSAAAVRALATEMEQAGYFAFEDNYPPDATDHATVTTSLKIGSREKRVEHNLGSRTAPAGLEALYARIDEVARTAKWIGEPQTGPPLKGRSSLPASSDASVKPPVGPAGATAAR